jgi:two-component system response regulator HydG
MQKLLVVDDSLPFLSDMEVLLRDLYTVVTASTGRKGLDMVRSEQVAAVLLDLMLPDISGHEVLKIIHREIDPLLPVIIITDHANVENAVVAMRNGAYDFMLKNFNRNILCEKIAKALERRSLEISVQALQGSFADMHDRFVFGSDVMRKVNMELTRLANLMFDVLIAGETGVGKDLAAFEIHRRGPRSEKPFLPLAMKALSETLIESELFGHERGAFSGADKAKVGKLEAASGGTLYIPEVSSLNETVQLKLLHFMQYKTVSKVGQDPRKPEIRVDARIIMATNEPLEEVVAGGKMRKDFYHRVAGVKLNIPPLRERIEDIEPLARYFLKKFARGMDSTEFKFAPEVIAAFKSYGWPGNIRELENWIKNALAYSNNTTLTLNDFAHFPEQKPRPDECRVCLATRFQVLPQYKEADVEFKRAYITEILRRAENRTSQAASIAGLTPQGLRKIMKAINMLEK